MYRSTCAMSFDVSHVAPEGEDRERIGRFKSCADWAVPQRQQSLRSVFYRMLCTESTNYHVCSIDLFTAMDGVTAPVVSSFIEESCQHAIGSIVFNFRRVVG